MFLETSDKAELRANGHHNLSPLAFVLPSTSFPFSCSDRFRNMPDNAESIAWEPRIRQNIQGQGTFIEVPPENRPGTPGDRGRTEGGEVSENILKFLEKFGLGLRRQRAILMARPQRRQRDIRGHFPHQAPVRLLQSFTLFGDKAFPRYARSHFYTLRGHSAPAPQAEKVREHRDSHANRGSCSQGNQAGILYVQPCELPTIGGV